MDPQNLCVDGASEPASGVWRKKQEKICYLDLQKKKETDATGIEELEESRCW